MAIYTRIFSKTADNAVAIEFGANTTARWAAKILRVRMTDQEVSKYGPANQFRFNNKSAVKLRIRFGLNIEDGAPFYDIEANSILNINVEDGISAYHFDVENLSTTTDCAIGEFQYVMSVVKQTPEIKAV